MGKGFRRKSLGINKKKSLDDEVQKLMKLVVERLVKNHNINVPTVKHDMMTQYTPIYILNKYILILNISFLINFIYPLLFLT